MNSYDQIYRQAVERVFNNWIALRFAVENGMAGPNGQKVAIDVMNYMYEYCTKNTNVTVSELEEVLEDLMDEELNTVCEDNSISEVCSYLVKYFQLAQQGKFNEIEIELNKLPNKTDWLRPGGKAVIIRKIDDSDEDSCSGDDSDGADEEMDTGCPDSKPASSSSTVNENNTNTMDCQEDGWTTVKTKKKK